MTLPNLDERQLEVAARRIAKQHGLDIPPGRAALQRSETEDVLLVPLRLQPITQRFESQIKLHSLTLELGMNPTLDVAEREIAMAAETLRGARLAHLLVEHATDLRIPEELRGEVLERVTGLLIHLAGDDGEMCKRIATHLLTHVESLSK